MLAQAKTRRAGGDIDQLAAAVTYVAILLVNLSTLSSALPIKAEQQGNNTKPWILDGQKTGTKEFPFLASIWEEQKDGGEHRCTGSIIGPNHIVTSAKCIDQTANELTAKLGCTHPARCSQETDIARVLVHPYYYLSRLKRRDQFDVALLLTSQKIDMNVEDGISPIGTKTDKMDPKCKRRFFLVGFGKNASSGRDAMLKFQVAFAQPKTCFGNNTVGKATMCVHSTTGILPSHFIGSALVAIPNGEKEFCANQESQLMGVVSTIAENLTSIVTDLKVTQNELWRLAGKDSKPRIGSRSRPDWDYDGGTEGAV